MCLGNWSIEAIIDVGIDDEIKSVERVLGSIVPACIDCRGLGSLVQAIPNRDGSTNDAFIKPIVVGFIANLS